MESLIRRTILKSYKILLFYPGLLILKISFLCGIRMINANYWFFKFQVLHKHYHTKHPTYLCIYLCMYVCVYIYIFLSNLGIDAIIFPVLLMKKLRFSENEIPSQPISSARFWYQVCLSPMPRFLTSKIFLDSLNG